MNEKRWQVVRQFYMESFGIAPELVDLMASNEILLMCVSGSSNKSISSILNIDIEAVSEILDSILSFKGWEKDLEYSPYSIYKEDPEYISFVGTIRDSDNNDSTTIDTINIMYNNCKIYESIEERLEIDWK